MRERPRPTSGGQAERLYGAPKTKNNTLKCKTLRLRYRSRVRVYKRMTLDLD
jgi:hypothetical protein